MLVNCYAYQDGKRIAEQIDRIRGLARQRCHVAQWRDMRADAENDGEVHRQKPERLSLDSQPQRFAGILGGDGWVVVLALMAAGLGHTRATRELTLNT